MKRETGGAESPLRVDGFLVGRTMLRNILDMMNLFDIPEDGLVFGVVVDSAGQPVQGATVSTTGGASVVYPDSLLQTAGFVSTDSRGYFLSTNAPFNSTWRARGTGCS